MLKKILIIEDEINLARFLELELVHESFAIKTISDGRLGLQTALDEEWDMILLDLMLPGLNGIEVCRRIRSVKHTPIIMLTARDSVMDRVSGLDSGADDYISKPFAIEELLARIRAIFRRSDLHITEQGRTILTLKGLSVNLDSRMVTKGEQVIELTKKEYDLLVVFLQNPDRVLTRDVLLDQIWGFQTGVETNVVDVYVRYLRNKIDSGEETSLIQTLRGIGYVMRK